MSMVCPQCNDAFEQRLSCPNCGVRLYYHSAGGPVNRPNPNRRWQQSAIGRVLLGLVLAQGLWYGLGRLYTSFELVSKEQLSLNDSNPVVLIVLQGLQLLALLLGGLLAGAGHPAGEGIGAAVGLVNGLLCVVFQPIPGQGATTVALYSQPLLQAAVGALAGWIGRAVWKPLPSASPTRVTPAAKIGVPRRPMASLFQGRVAWVRVAIGSIVAVVGSLSAALILERAIAAGAPRGGVAAYHDLMYLQDRILTWEIKALALLFGGALAGINTRNGLKQGLCVGVVATLVLAGVLAAQGRATLPVLGGTALSALCLSLVGGWFGCQLLPPVLPSNRGRGFGTAAAF
jgi:hypothetical protein